MVDLIEMFVDELPDRLAALERAFMGRRMDDLGRSAHQLKGAGGSYGFDEVTKAAAQLEQTVREQAAEEVVRNAVDELSAICRRLRGC